MRHRDQHQAGDNQANETGSSETEAKPSDTAEDTGNSPGVTMSQLMDTGRPIVGKHRAPVLPMPHVPKQNLPVQNIPEQLVPTHDNGPENGPEKGAEEGVGTGPDTGGSKPVEPVAELASTIPTTALWRASHLPRIFVAILLVLATIGTSGLGVRYVQSRGSDDFVALMIGLGVVVVLWAVLIASTPQVVRLEGSVLTVRNSGSTDSFDLADGLQDVEVVGDPKTSHWAVLLHRPNSTTVVLRRHDVKADELDPIVRHFRAVAFRRGADRQARFAR